jgi:hypothetical protein
MSPLPLEPLERPASNVSQVCQRSSHADGGYTRIHGFRWFQPIQDICQANLFHRHYRENDLAPDRVTSGLKVLCVSRFAMVC